jgi:hypothetical protein
MGDIIPPNTYTSLKEQILETHGKQIKLTLYEGTESDSIFLGGHTKFCIDGLVQKSDSEFAKRGGDVSNAFLSHIYYDVNCSLDGKFRRSLDTNTIMLLFLSYVKNNYAHIKSVSFTDTSTKQCDNNQYVELAEMSYVRTGQTWYQKHFHAYLDSFDKAKLERCEEKFQEAKKKMSWDEFKRNISGPLPLDEAAMMTLFTKAGTWQEFFEPLANIISIPKFCEFVSPWLHRFLQIHLTFNFSSAQFMIPLDKLTHIEYNTLGYERGGRRFTAKKRRGRPQNEH